MKRTKRFLAMLLTLILCVSEIGSTGLKVFAAGEESTDIDDEMISDDKATTYKLVALDGCKVNGERSITVKPDQTVQLSPGVPRGKDFQQYHFYTAVGEDQIDEITLGIANGGWAKPATWNTSFRIPDLSTWPEKHHNKDTIYVGADYKEGPGPVNISVTAPKVGEKPDFTATTDCEYCTIVDDQVNWKDGDTILDERHTFINGHTYEAIIWLKDNGDNKLRSWSAVNINGKEADFLFEGSGYTYAFGYDFRADQVNISITDPVAGAKPDFKATTDSEICTVMDDEVSWYDNVNGRFLTADSTFIAGGNYSAIIWLTPKDSYTINNETDVRINGNPAAYLKAAGDSCMFSYDVIVEESAPVTYGLWVGGTPVTEDNKDSIPCDSGTASYDPETNTLTFKDAKISSGYEYNTSAKRTAGVYAKGTDLTIKGNLTVDGAAIKDAICVEDTAANGKKLILDGNITVKGEYGISTKYTGVEINGGKLEIDATTVAVKAGAPVSLGTGMKVLSPEGAVFRKNAYDVYLLYESEDSNVQVKKATIGSGVTETYTVSFDLNGKTGTAPSSQKIEKGKTATKPSDPSADGFTFVAWCTDKAGEKVYDFANPVTSDITLYAKWVDAAVETYTVTFDLNGKEGTAPSPQKVEKGKTATKPADPKTDGFTFKAWCTDKEGKKEYDFSTAVNADITLYAKWEKAEDPAPVPDPLEGGRSPLDSVPELIAGETTDLYLVKGQKFNIGQGWYVDKNDKDSKKRVSISKKGAFKAKAEGEAVIKCGSGASYWEVKLHISKPKMESKSLKIQLETATEVKQEQIVFDYDKANLDVLWYSANPDVVTVDDTGKVTTVGKGSSKVTAYINGSAYTCTVTVKEKVGLQKRTLHVAKDASKTISIKGLKKPEWKPSEEGIVNIKGNKITGLKSGNVDLSFTQGDITYTVAVTVEDINMSGTGLKPGKNNKYTIDELKIGETTKLAFTAVDQDVVFKSSKPDIAFIDEDFNVVIRKKGKAKFTAKINGKPITISVNVK